ncbi:MAG: tetratricopeptide repeat protein [Okeania sp. SIO3I5]|uniref:tetratricopeptide repeat protein n=1 Tax=Okeania sp. SIO3I5 TaxID=2607805 RepID=UPI0013B9FACF|nr:tetratricopeptide repeat protein [Okeania sp. SIO3I5]NEQ39464.1 tetratricopeptide repeat protein [Okeania sp. SIO3I5]
MGKTISAIYLNQKAEIYLAQGKLEAAITACHQALEIVSNFPPTCKILGNIMQRMGEIDRGKDWYIKAINQQPNLAESYANLGSIYAQQKQWQLAIECYQEAISIKPNFPGFYRNLGKIWQQLGKVELARDCQEQAFNLAAQYPKASEHFKQGKTLWETEKIEEAIACFQDAIKFNPFLTGAYQHLGDIFLEKEDFNEAINYYQRAIELKPDLWAFHHKLGKVFQKIGELDSAISSFCLSIEINPNFPWSYKKLGDILFEQGKLESAEKSYQKVIDIKSDTWEVRRKLVEIQLQKGKLDEAIIGCIQVIEINPNLTWFNQILQENLSKLEPHDRAVNYYRDLIKIEPKNVKLLDDLGERLVKIQEWDEAIIVYRRAIELEPNNHLFHRKLADIALQTGKLDEAISIYKTGIEVNPNSCENYTELGKIYLQQQKFSKAIFYLLQALKINPYYGNIQEKITDILTKQGRQKAANVWKYDQKLPKDWLEKFFNLTGDWEITSNSRENNITRINIHSPTEVNLLPSKTIDRKIHQSFQGKKAKSVGGFIVVVPDGRGCVKSGTTAVITSNNKLVTDISTGCAEIILSELDLLQVHYIDGIVAFLSVKCLEQNYFHCFFDLVYRIDLLYRSNMMPVIDKFVFNTLNKKFHKETLEALHIPLEKVIESRFIPHIKAKELIVPSFTAKQGGLRVTKWGCEFLKSVFLKPEIRHQLSGKPERIYISRKLASWRRVINEEEVVNLLNKYGFVSLTLESMSVEEQALCLGAAKFIITPHGAGLTNLVFCTIGTKVIEIFSPKFITSLYWQISNLCGLLHYYLIGEDFDNLNSSKSMPYAPDILVNIDKLLKIMQLAGVA